MREQLRWEREQGEVSKQQSGAGTMRPLILTLMLQDQREESRRCHCFQRRRGGGKEEFFERRETGSMKRGGQGGEGRGRSAVKAGLGHEIEMITGDLVL